MRHASFALVIAVCMSVTAGTATEDLEVSELVGFTRSTLPGDQGILRMNLLCHAEMPFSRVCTSEEVLQTTHVPDLQSSATDAAWVRPRFMSAGDMTVDPSGADGGAAEVLSCNGWRASGLNDTGLTVDRAGSFRRKPCLESRSVACCAVPEALEVRSPHPLRPHARLTRFTASAVRGDHGALKMTLLCQSEDPGTRICTNEEVLESIPETGFVAPGTSEAWLRPVFKSGGTVVTDASGTRGVAALPPQYTCNGWSASGSFDTGLAVSTTGRFPVTPCATSLSVACCVVGR